MLFKKKVGAAGPASEYAEENTKLKLELAKLLAIQSAMPDPYYARDMEYNVILWPDAIAKMMGYTEAEALKMKCYDIFKAAVCPPVADCPTAHCIEVRQFLRDVEVDCYRKDGSTIHCLVSNAGIYDENGKTIGAVEVVKHNAIKESISVIEGSIKDVGTVADVVNSAIEQVNDIGVKVNDMAHESLDSTKEGVQAGNIVYQKAEESNRYATRVRENMQAITESMRTSVESITTLKAKSESITEFISVIKSIATQTNLLAINASIEAAHAGEHGKGFMVVANGIRELSQDSEKSARSIDDIVTEINSMIKSTTESLNSTEQDIREGENRITKLLDRISEIDEAVKKLLDTIASIERSAAATTGLEAEQNTSVRALTESGNELSGIAERLTSEFDRMIRIIRRADMGA